MKLDDGHDIYLAAVAPLAETFVWQPPVRVVATNGWIQI
jgi:hypothetical protein